MRSRIIKIGILLWMVAAPVLTVHSQTTTPATQPQPCTEAQRKQLDFWLGDWDLTWPGAKQNEIAHGRNTVKRIMDNCVVQENFSGEDSTPLRGMSVSSFNPSTGKWNQTWVDNQGAYLDFVGEFKDGEMILAREAAKSDGTRIIQRMVFRNINANEFDWSWEASKDGGKTWTVQWPIHYKRRS